MKTNETAVIDTFYPELKEPKMSFAEIVSLLTALSDGELEMLDEDKFASALITLHH